MENKISERDEEQENKATSAERSQKDLIKWRKQYEYEAEENVKEKMQNLSLFTRNLDQWIKNPAQESQDVQGRGYDSIDCFKIDPPNEPSWPTRYLRK